MSDIKNDNSVFVNAGAGWLNGDGGGRFYSLKFESDTFDKYLDHLIVNGCLLIKNKYKGDDTSKPDVILRLRVPSDEVEGEASDSFVL